MAKCDVYPSADFACRQVWPGAYGNTPAREGYPCPEDAAPVIHQQTPVVTIGSCFAREIKDALINAGYNHLQTEADQRAARHGSAAWERIYSTFCLRQVFQYSFSDWNPDLRWWITPQTSKVQDPFRRDVLYDTMEQAEGTFAAHRDASRQVLTQAKVIIIALESTEIWEDKKDGQVIALPAGPYVSEGGDMSRYRFRVSRYDENLMNLTAIHSLLSLHNPDCAVIVVVSPVHLWATFRHDVDVITAGGNVKATLRAVADEFASRHDNVFYFPALEIATTWQAINGKCIFAEGRENFHMNPETLKTVMEHLFLRYGHPDEKGRPARDPSAPNLQP